MLYVDIFERKTVYGDLGKNRAFSQLSLVPLNPLRMSLSGSNVNKSDSYSEKIAAFFPV